MDFSLDSGTIWASRAKSFVIPVTEEDGRAMPARLKEALHNAKGKKLFQGKEGEVFVFENHVFVGLGKKGETQSYSRCIASAYPRLKLLGVESAAVWVESASEAYSAVLGLDAASYAYLDFKKEKPETFLKKVHVHTRDPEAAGSLKKAKIVSRAVRLARDLSNTPSNVATPAYMAHQAQKTARENGLTAKVFDEKALEKGGFCGILAVGMGSVHLPRLVVLEYHAGAKKPWIAFVGKGITFDSGGISIKPSADMDKMKYDKSGACSVLGAMSALKELNCPVNVVAVMPFAENLPSGTAYRPGDVVTSYSGKTIEVLNTDAEGRVVLADALSFVQKNYPLSGIVDLATLTGACCVALGEDFAGLFSMDDALSEKLSKLSRLSGDPAWPLPLKPYLDQVKGEFGDVKNIGHPKGYAGASTGAAFLKQFVEKTPWAHFDIAGTAWNTSPKGGLGIGSTGFGVKLLLAIAEEPNLFNAPAAPSKKG